MPVPPIPLPSDGKHEPAADPTFPPEASASAEVMALREHIVDLQRRMARYEEGGEKRRMSGLDVSISEREELLVEAERIVHMGSWVWDVDSDSVSWSDELYRILGYDPETEPASRERFYQAVHPLDQARLMAGSREVLETGRVGEGHFRMLRKDGAIRHTLANGAVLFDADGRLRRIVGTILDITDRHEPALKLEQANRLLQEAQALAQLGSFSYDVASESRHWSPELYRIMGVDPALPLTRTTFQEQVHPDDLPLLKALAGRIDARPPTATDDPIDFRIVRPDGSVRHLRLRSTYEPGKDGAITGVRGIVQDMTEVTLLQKRLAQAERMEMIGRLAGGIAHDFNNIMMVIHGGAELLSNTDPADAEILAQMKAAVRSARDLTGRLLAFGRQSALRPQRLDPNKIVNDTVLLVTRILGEHVTLDLQLDPDVPAATLDKHLTSQALVNLIINARDAMPGGGRIVLTTRRVDGPAGLLVEFGVRDSGPGIAANLRDKVFEPFFTTKHEGHGTGLGLAMVQGAVEQQGGSITLESGADGTLFLLRFAAAPEDVTATASPTKPLATNEQRRLRILVVEDQETLAYMVQRLLRRAGHDAWVCTLPSAAIELYRQRGHEFDLILSDVLMPEMSGMELVDRLAAIAPLPRVAFMSGYGAEAGRTLGHDRIVLAKPFTNQELLATIARVMRD